MPTGHDLPRDNGGSSVHTQNKWLADAEKRQATQIAYQGAYLGRQKSEAGPFFAPRTSIPRPFSDATDISDSDHYEYDYEDEDELSYPENSPFTSVASVSYFVIF